MADMNITQDKNPIPAGFKLTEIGVIPEDWTYDSLERVCPPGKKYGIVDGPFGSNLKTEHYKKSGIPIISSGFVTTGQFLADEYIFVDEEKFRQEKRSAVAPGDIVMAKIGARCGASAILPIKHEIGILSGNALKITVNENKHETYFIWQFLWDLYSKGKFEDITAVGAQPAISMPHLKKLLIPLPTKSEQTAIANVLSDTDELITELEQLITKKEAIKTATMQQLLTGRTRLPQFAKHPDGTLKSYKASELGLIPEDWECAKLDSLAKIQRGASPRPIDSPIWFDRNSSVGWLRISDVSKTKKYLINTTQSLSDLGIAHSRFVPANNLLMSICATVGKPIITKKDLCIHDGFVVFNGLSTDQNYMYYILKDLEDEWGNQGQTGSQMNLNTDLIKKTFVHLPSALEEQTAIATNLSDMDAELSVLEQKLAKFRDIKQGMMQQLLTGRIRLPLEQQP
ncbi:restriction endonuclease subunit S [Enterobacter sp.]|uniref:restriction endonuclease subunit S n=1 Tax=Enterobacter sp. TaxID=42895 RepID=UPI00296EA1E5|nr:restriction endonuclease subunit S [Enterobacter sp.]